MKLTKIRNSDGSKLTERMVEEYAQLILQALNKKGFKTNAYATGATSMKIGLHMSSFRIDTTKLGHNARVGIAAYGYNGCKSPKGYKRTDVPTWDQRVEFNDTVNYILDKFNIHANIKSGAYTIRKGDWSYCENDWYNQGSNFSYSADASRQIIPEAEARESLDSDRLEAEHKLAMKVVTSEKAKARREKQKAIRQAKKLKVYLSGYPKPKIDKVVTQNAFQKLLLKLEKWERRHLTVEPIGYPF